MTASPGPSATFSNTQTAEIARPVISVATFGGTYRTTLLLVAIACLLAQIVTIASLSSVQTSATISELLQTFLGFAAVLAMVDAGRRSAKFSRRVWFLAASAMGTYSIGQAIHTYFVAFNISTAYDRITSEFFFFWSAPLMLAGAVSWNLSEILDWDLVLDLLQMLVLGLAIHLLIFGSTSRWERLPLQMGLLDWKARMARDFVVLTVLAGRSLFSRPAEVRSLFRRLGLFYLVYSLTGGLYKYVEATMHVRPGTWFDIGWSIPRVVAVIVTITWAWPDELAGKDFFGGRRSRLLYLPPILVPLSVLVISSRMLATAPTASAFLVVVSLAVAGVRLLLTQFRQEHVLADLRRSSYLLQSVVEGTSEAVYLKDREGRYLLMNSAGARFMGRTVEEIVDKKDKEIFSGEVLEAIRRADDAVISQGQSVTGQETITIGGSTRTFLSTKNPLRDSEGRITGVLGVSMDVTELRRMEEQLRRAQRMESIGTFSGAIAHDFNNLLTVIKGYSQLMLNSGEDSRFRACVEQVDRASDRAASLTRQLLAFSRQQILQPRVISLNDIISNLQKFLQRLIGEDVEIATHLDPDLGPVKADPGQIEQVLMNLAANARDAMPHGGRMTIETKSIVLDEEYSAIHGDAAPGQYAMIAVSDTGIGMDANTQAHIFEPFFTTKPIGKGTGLGLATVYGIVKQSGGYIWVYSELGAGTTFKVYLPRVDEPVEYLAGTTHLIPSTHRGNETILLVEDDAQLRQLTSDILTSAGYRVLPAEGADQAQGTAVQHSGPIHLLLTDVVMPGASGREVARRICGKRCETKVLYMSGYTGEAIVHHGVLDSGISFLQKPFTPTALMETVREVLDSTNAV